MQGEQSQYKEPLTLLKKYQQYLLNRPQEHTEILVHERLVYLLATAMDTKEGLPKGLNLLTELCSFVNKINVKVMSDDTLEFSQKLNLISKCVDMLFYKPIRNNVKPPEKMLQLRALTFSNLSCIYKMNKQAEDALKALEMALQIEEALLDKNYEDTYKSIVSTYINKSVILSHLSLHEEAIDTIKSSLDNIEKYRARFSSEIDDKSSTELKNMSMFAYFNIAVEHEHLKHWEVANKFYEMAFRLAKQLGNWSLKSQIITAMKKLKTLRK